MLGRSSSTTFVVLADGLVEGAGGLLHLRGRLDGLSVVGDGDALSGGVHVYRLGGDGTPVNDYVLQDVARGVVDGVLDLTILGARGVVDPVTLNLCGRVVGPVIRFFHLFPPV